VHHEGGVVVDIGQGAADEDFGELVVMPGLVDSHVHVNEPGRESWEGFRTATRAAAAGGTTTIVDMPLNSIPPTVDPEALAAKRTAAAGGIAVDVAFWGGLIPGSEPWVESLVGAGVCGFKSFLVDSGVPEFPPMTLSGLEAVLPELARLGVPLLLHAEDPIRLHQMSGDTRSYRTYLESRPPESEGEAVGQAVLHLLAIAQLGASVALLHLPGVVGSAVLALGFHAWAGAAEALENGAPARAVAVEFGSLALLGLLVALLLRPA